MKNIKFDECNQPYYYKNGIKYYGCPGCGAATKDACFCGTCTSEKCEVCGDPVQSYPGSGLCNIHVNEKQQSDMM